MKRLLTMFLAALMLFTLVVPAAAADLKAFNDVNNSSWYAPSVYALVQEGVISGKSAATFDPQGNLTRAELMKMLASSVKSSAELAEYADAGSFTDVPSGSWFAPYVNWAAANGITNGYSDGSFGPNRAVTRAEAASLVVRFAQKTGVSDLKAVNGKTTFADDQMIAGWAKENIYICQQAGIFGGYQDGTFRGGSNIVRSEAAAVLCRLLGVAPLPKDQLPEQSDPTLQLPAGTFRKTVAGCSVTGIELRGYRLGVILANDHFYQVEPASSMVSRSGAEVVCNGPFFNNNGDLTTYIAAVLDGRALRIDNAHYPKKCYLVFDESGNASMQFLKVCQTANLMQDGIEVSQYEEVGCNFAFGDADGSRMVFTEAFGSKVPGTVKCAAVCDRNGVVTDVFDSDTARSVSIPKDGFVLCQRHRRDEGQEYKWDTFFSKCRVGDTIRLEISYEGSTVQNIRTAISGGPTVVKNGQPYGNVSTYNEEGVTEVALYSSSAPRTGIGVKADGTVVIAIATCTFQGLGQVMAGLGCQTAMVLDGGASTALYVNGAAVYAAGRQLSHMLTFSK